MSLANRKSEKWQRSFLIRKPQKNVNRAEGKNQRADSIFRRTATHHEVGYLTEAALTVLQQQLGKKSHNLSVPPKEEEEVGGEKGGESIFEKDK